MENHSFLTEYINLLYHILKIADVSSVIYELWNNPRIDRDDHSLGIASADLLGIAVFGKHCTYFGKNGLQCFCRLFRNFHNNDLMHKNL